MFQMITVGQASFLEASSEYDVESAMEELAILPRPIAIDGLRLAQGFLAIWGSSLK